MCETRDQVETPVPDFIIEGRLRVQELMRRLHEGEITTVVGVVPESGIGGCRSMGEEHWTLLINLKPWRNSDGKIDTRELVIRQLVTEVELDAMRALIRPFDIIEVSARVIEPYDGFPNFVHGLLMDTPRKGISDAELAAYPQKRQKIITLDDDYFGQFVLIRSIRCYSIQLTWKNAPVYLYLAMKKKSDIPALLQSAKDLWRELNNWDKRMRECAVQRLLDGKNASWLEEGEEKASAETFKGKMTLAAVSLYPNEKIEFAYHDGNLFRGHQIQVSGTLADGPAKAKVMC